MRALTLLALVGCASTPPSAPTAANATSLTPAPDVAASEPVRVGQRAPAIDLRAIDMTRAQLAAGKVNVVFFWATWSAPDKKSFPPIAELWEKRRSEGLAVLGISVDDDPRGVAEFAHTNNGTFPIAWDEGRRVAERYRPEAEPTSYVIDRKGIIRFVNAGWHDGQIVQLGAQVDALLRE